MPILFLLLIALTMIVVGAVMARVAFSSSTPALAGQGTATTNAPGALGS